MTLHKLTAGDGYTYLTRQVAAHDSTERGHAGLADYYSERGEAPGMWWGGGLAGVELAVGSIVEEAQMRSLFGSGQHPDAERLAEELRAIGRSQTDVEHLVRLGSPFRVYEGGATELQQGLARRLAQHNIERGRRWDSPVPAHERSAIRTAVAEELFHAAHGRVPLDDRELAGFVAVGSRQRTSAVAGYDLTFTPVKSVSALWALADADVSREVADAHHSAVRQTLDYLEKEVLFTRRGRDGVQQVTTRGMLATLFVHRDSRAGDPNLHTHVAVSNKVQDETGRWLAVDGRVLYKAGVTLSEMYNSLLEAELWARLPVRFTSRSGGTVAGNTDGKRVVRELAGIHPQLLSAWSSRSTAIEVRRRELARDFQDAHHRPPTATESIALAQQANLETRQAKHVARSEAEQRTAWRTEAVEVLGSEAMVSAMVSRTLSHGQATPKVTKRWVDEAARAVVDRVQEDRACWQVWHLRAEAWRRTRESDIGVAEMAPAVERVVRRAVAAYSVDLPEPEALTSRDLTPASLRREDGTPVYVEHASPWYTSRLILDAESRLLSAAQRDDGRTADSVSVRAAVLASRQAGLRLTTSQERFVHRLATSGRRVQVALAPAGSGKTTALSVLCDAWRRSDGVVRGLAPSAVAAAQLHASLNEAPSRSDVLRTGEVVCETVSKYAWSLAHTGELPWWVDQVDDRTLVIVDEAGMAATTDLDAVVSHVLSRGGSVRLVGDDRQLASVNAGGILRDITSDHGAVTLSEIRRFSDTAEAAATLAIREGDPSALGFYADRGRVHVGDLGAAVEDAFAAWARDLDHDKSSVMLAPTRDLVRQLNERAQQHHRYRASERRSHRDEIARTAVALRDGQEAGVGDRVISRRNDRGLRFGSTDWVKNGDRWTIIGIADDSTALVRHDVHGSHIRLPAAYVAEHLDLGYATTVHSAQGITADSSHTILTGQEDRALLYVALSRGRHRNDVYLVSPGDGDPHSVVHPGTIRPPTAIDVLESILARDGSAVSATTTLRGHHDPFTQLHGSVLRFLDAVTFAAEQALGQTRLDQLTRDAHSLVPRLSDQPAWPTLRSHLALAAADDHDPTTLLARAVQQARLDDVRDPAAVLDARIGQTLNHSRRPGVGDAAHGPLPWLPGIPESLLSDLDWGPYLTARHAEVTGNAHQIAEQVRQWAPATAPAWARPFLATTAGTELVGKLAVWRAAHDVPDTDHRPTGPALFGTPGDHQAPLRREANALHPAYQYKRRAWFQQLPPEVIDDPWSATLARRLANLERAGLIVTDYLSAALDDGPTRVSRPLPNVHPAAALWWRIVPHLGPAALDLDAHEDPLRPDWLDDLTTLIGAEHLDAAQLSPAWPALVASVDDACREHGWTPSGLLIAAAPSSTNFETASQLAEAVEALVFRIASLTDPPRLLGHRDPTPHPFVNNGAPIGEAPRSSFADQDEPESSVVTRIHELNRIALDFYTQCYLRSWAPTYLAERLKTPIDQLPAIAGYAPPGPTSLVRHMAALGIDPAELIDAGLARTRERGGRCEVVDVFRDRLVLPVHTLAPGSTTSDELDNAVAGFLGRRNPHREYDQYAGPKYLNTRATPAFQKSELLYSLVDGLPALRAGAIPILVEGPMDAIAINLALPGKAVGIAPMGTALTSSQARLLRRQLSGRHDQLVVATDGDPTGWRAARAAYWLLTAEDLDPSILRLAGESDPASLLHDEGPDAVRALLTNRRSLGDVMIDDALRTATDWTDASARQELLEQIGHVMAARPAATWQAAEQAVRERLHLSPGILIHQVLADSRERDTDPSSWTHGRVREARAAAAAPAIGHRTPPAERPAAGRIPMPDAGQMPIRRVGMPARTVVP